MQAGRLRHRVVIQSPSEDTDTRGEVTLGWGNLATVWADVVPLAGAERVEAATISAGLTHRVSMRHRSDVTSKDRVLFGERVFEIVHVIDVGELGREIRLLCKETS